MGAPTVQSTGWPGAANRRQVARPVHDPPATAFGTDDRRPRSWATASATGLAATSSAVSTTSGDAWAGSASTARAGPDLESPDAPRRCHAAHRSTRRRARPRRPRGLRRDVLTSATGAGAVITGGVPGGRDLGCGRAAGLAGGFGVADARSPLAGRRIRPTTSTPLREPLPAPGVWTGPLSPRLDDRLGVDDDPAPGQARSSLKTSISPEPTRLRVICTRPSEVTSATWCLVRSRPGTPGGGGRRGRGWTPAPCR